MVKQGQNKDGETILYLVFEYMDTDLKKFIRSFRKTAETIPLETVNNLMYQLCKGVSFCHGHGVLHRDLKPQNLLMDRKTMMLKIADLGLARQQVTVPLKKYTQEILTLWYRAPEVLVGARRYSTPIDMWSVGCIFAELVTNEPLFPGDSELQHFIHIFRLLGTPNEELWLGVSKLMNWREHPQWKPKNLASVVPNMDANGLDLLSMLQNEPSKRMSAKKAMEHPYLMILIKHTFESLLQWYRFKHKSVFLLFLKHTSLCTTVEKLLIVYQPVWNDKTTHFRLPWVVLVHYIVNLPRVIFKIIITGSPEIIAFDLSQLSNQTPMYLSLLGK